MGSSGAGKTVLVFSELARLPETHSQLVMNFSATTDSGTTQVCVCGRKICWRLLLTHSN